MNKSYRSIWNESLGAWVAVSEVASARGKRSKRSVVGAAVALVIAAGAGAAHAQYTGNQSNYGSVPTGSTGVAIGTGTTAATQATVSGDVNILDRGNPGNARKGATNYNVGTAGVGGVAIGRKASSTGGAVAIGDNAVASSLGIGIGAYASGTGVGSFALGTAALASGNTSIAVGRQSAATPRANEPTPKDCV